MKCQICRQSVEDDISYYAPDANEYLCAQCGLQWQFFVIKPMTVPFTFRDQKLEYHVPKLSNKRSEDIQKQCFEELKLEMLENIHTAEQSKKKSKK